MKRFLISLVAVLTLASMASALTIESDYLGVNRGGKKTGVFNKVQIPIIKGFFLNGYESKITTSEVSSGEAKVGVVIASATDAYIYIIAKTKTGGTYLYRTISLFQTASDEVVAK